MSTVQFSHIVAFFTVHQYYTFLQKKFLKKLLCSRNNTGYIYISLSLSLYIYIYIYICVTQKSSKIFFRPKVLWYEQKVFQSTLNILFDMRFFSFGEYNMGTTKVSVCGQLMPRTTFVVPLLYAPNEKKHMSKSMFRVL